jgi:hypothetical protein
VRKRKDVFAVLRLKKGGNADYGNEDRLNAGRGRRPYYVMCALAERAIRMCRAILMDVRQLHQAAKEKKKRKERYEPNTNLRIRRPQFAHSSHDS